MYFKPENPKTRVMGFQTKHQMHVFLENTSVQRKHKCFLETM